jgi:hypothetical protein
MSDLHDLWRERQQVGTALDSGLLADDDPAWERFPDLDQAIREARPTDPAGLAIQMRLLADEFAAIGHVADETLARGSPPHSKSWAKMASTVSRTAASISLGLPQVVLPRPPGRRRGSLRGPMPVRQPEGA